MKESSKQYLNRKLLESPLNALVHLRQAAKYIMNVDSDHHQLVRFILFILYSFIHSMIQSWLNKIITTVHPLQFFRKTIILY